MATRLYIRNTTVAGTYPTQNKGAWDDTSVLGTRPLAASQYGVSPSLFSYAAAVGTDKDVLLVRAVSDTIPSARTIAGTLSWCLDVQEDNAAVNAYTHIHVWVSDGGTNTMRGTLLTDALDDAEWPTSYAGRGQSALALSSVDAQAGDRIIIEVGFRYTLASNSYNNKLRYGGTGTDATEDNSGISWFEFSQSGLLLPIVDGEISVTDAETMFVRGVGDPRIVIEDSYTTRVLGRQPVPHAGIGKALSAAVRTPTGVNVPSVSDTSLRWSVKGGPVTADLDVREADDLLLSEVRCFNEGGLGWHGWVWDAPKDGKITALGSSAPLSMLKSDGVYCDTTPFQWEQSPWFIPGELDPIYTNIDGVVRGIWQPEVSYPTLSRVELISRLPYHDLTSFTLSFEWERNHASSKIAFFAEVPAENVYGCDYVKVAEVTGSNLSGTTTANISLAGMNRMLLQIYGFTNASPMVDGYTIKVWNVKLYGQGTTAVRPDTVLTTSIGRLPSWAFPASSLWQSWIDESSATVEPFVMNGRSDAECVQEAFTYDSMDYYWAPEFVGMEQRYVPHAKDRETSASLAVDEAYAAFDFTPADMESLASRAIVSYRDKDGREKRLTVTDIDESHYLVRIGRVMDIAVSVDTDSQSSAQSMGELALAEAGADTSRGTVSTRYLRTAKGCPIPLSDARVGTMLDLGERSSRITALERKGSSLTISLDDEPYRLSAALAKLGRR